MEIPSTDIWGKYIVIGWLQMLLNVFIFAKDLQQSQKIRYNELINKKTTMIASGFHLIILERVT